MAWINFHSHTHFCDGNSAPETYIQKAVELGLIAYGYSSHAPVAFPTDWCIKDDKFQLYIEEINRLKTLYADKIEVYLGLEIDYIPGISGRMKHLPNNQRLDYFIGSIHFVDKFEDGSYWNIDTSADLFERGLKNIFNNNFRQAADKFFDLTEQLIVEEKPDILGHIDKIKMFNVGEKYFRESEKWYRNRMEHTLKIIKQTGTLVEVNTRGYYKYNQLDLYPSQWIIELMGKNDIPVILNSDSHTPAEIISGFEYAVDKLKQARVKQLWGLIENKWQRFNYDRKGIVL